MAVTSEVFRIRVVIKLDNGTNSFGEKRTISVPLPSLNKDAFDAEKVYAIVAALTPIFSKSVYYAHKTEESSITDE